MNETSPNTPTITTANSCESGEQQEAAAATAATAVVVGVKSPRCWTLWPLTLSFCPLRLSIGASCWALWTKTNNIRTLCLTLPYPHCLSFHVPKIPRGEKKKVFVNRRVCCISQWGKKKLFLFTVGTSFWKLKKKKKKKWGHWNRIQCGAVPLWKTHPPTLKQRCQKLQAKLS